MTIYDKESWKDEFLGTVSFRVDTIPPRKSAGGEKWHSLAAKRGHESPELGEVQLDLFIDRKRASLVSIDTTASLDSNSKKRRGSSDKPGSPVGKSAAPETPPAADPKWSGDRRPSETSLTSRPRAETPRIVASEAVCPQVTGVSPNSAPEAAGARVVIRGENLGYSREDVVSLSICGVECAQNIEIHSTTRIVCKTPVAQARGTGRIVIQTHSGGLGDSSVLFTFLKGTLIPPYR